jgi:hypothetical protein
MKYLPLFRAPICLKYLTIFQFNTSQMRKKFYNFEYNLKLTRSEFNIIWY